MNSTIKGQMIYKITGELSAGASVDLTTYNPCLVFTGRAGVGGSAWFVSWDATTVKLLGSGVNVEKTTTGINITNTANVTIQYFVIF